MGVRDVGAGDDGLQANTCVLVERQWAEKFGRVRSLLSPCANDARGVRARSRVLRPAEMSQQFWCEDFMTLMNPERFLQRVLCEIFLFEPFFERSDGLRRRLFSENAFCEVPSPAVG